MMTAEERDPLTDGFDSIASVMAWVHHSDGAEGLGMMLEWMIDPDSAPTEMQQILAAKGFDKGPPLGQKDLMKAEAELQTVGLAQVAAIVAEYAAQAAALPEVVCPRWGTTYEAGGRTYRHCCSCEYCRKRAVK